MNQDASIRLCKNKKCQKPLAEGYKHKYCEACRTQQAQKVKNAGKKVLEVAGAALIVVTAGKISHKKQS